MNSDDAEILLTWYDTHGRELPWRKDPTPYHILVSEMMLQQTRIQTVLPYYDRFISALPDFPDLAVCPEERLLKLWQGLGYYRRARNLKRCAERVCELFGGTLPPDPSFIRSLPGVGEYTAGAILSVAFQIPSPAVDGNVLRVFCRLTGDERDITKGDVKKEVQMSLSSVLPPRRPGDFNQALMELGELVCLPSSPLCNICPLAHSCTARKENRADFLPFRSPAKPRKVETRDVFLIIRDEKVALHQRENRGLLAGLWEFPNALSPAPCPVSGISIFYKKAVHMFSHIEWHMTAYLVDAASPVLPSELRWVKREELEKRYPIPGAFSSFLDYPDRFPDNVHS